jgi:recombination protein RecA
MPPKTKATSFTSNWTSNKASPAALRRFEETFANDMGVGIVRTNKPAKHEVIPTGSLNLDDALKIGGYPRGRMVEIWGPEHAGKTSLTMMAVAAAQRADKDKVAGWIDMEQTFDPVWAQALGVDLDRLLLVPNPHTAEDVADAAKRLVHSGLCSIVAVDSVGSMITMQEFEKESDEVTVAAVARVVTRMVKQCAPMCMANGTTFIAINQVRANISAYGGSTTRTGGFALAHISSIRLNVKRGAGKLTIVSDGNDLPVGHEVVVRVEKNKLAPYGSVANFFLINVPTQKHGPIGVDKAAESLPFGVKLGIIEGGAGGRYVLPGDLKFHGVDKAVAHLRTDPALVEQIRAAMLQKNKEQVDESPDEPQTDDAMAKLLGEL